jgi:Domain of unknown function (DUF4386)
MNGLKWSARRAGMLYFVFSVIAIVNEFVLPAAVVPGDASGTARNIIAGARTFRLGILSGLANQVIFIFLALALYSLFRETGRKLARLMVLLVFAGIVVTLSSLVERMAPLVLLSGADYLSAFTRPQLDALSMSFLRMHATAGMVAAAFWGLWLFPFGLLVIRSGYFPRILGALLIVAGLAYVVTSVTSIGWPEHRALVTRIMTPLYVGEVPIILWMAIAGASEPRSASPSGREPAAS